MAGRWMALGWLMAGILPLASCGANPDPFGSTCVDRDASLTKVAGDGQRGATGVPLPLPVTVRLFNTCNNASTTVSWSASRGSVSSRETRVDPAGYASVVWTPEETPDGVNRLYASVPSQRAAGQVEFTAHVPLSPETYRPVCGVARLDDHFDYDDAQWTKTTQAPAGFQDSVVYEVRGGEFFGGDGPGGYRRMTHVLAGRGLMVVSHMFAEAYAPRERGFVTRILYSEDRKQLDPPFAGAAVGSGFLVEQEGRRVALPLPEIRDTSWQHAELIVTGADLPGIDLSSNGALIRFGYYRSNSDSTATVQHGIDNWQVEICR